MANLFANSLNLYKEKPIVNIKSMAKSRADCAAKCSMDTQIPGGDYELWEILYQICMSWCMKGN